MSLKAFEGRCAYCGHDHGNPYEMKSSARPAGCVSDSEADEYFMAGVLAALDVVYLHDPDPESVLAVEIVASVGRMLLPFAKKDEYHNLALLRKTIKAADAR